MYKVTQTKGVHFIFIYFPQESSATKYSQLLDFVRA